MRLVPLIALACLLALVPPAPAQDPPALVQPPGDAGCVADEATAASLDCVRAPGLVRPDDLVAASRGGDVYAVSARADRIVHLRADGSQVLRYVDCIGTQAEGCREAPGLTHVTRISISGDGRWVVAAGRYGNVISLLERDGRGRLRHRHCLTSRRAGQARTCTLARELAGATAVALRSDGRVAYVGLGERHAIVGLMRRGRELTPMARERGCLADADERLASALRGCARAPGIGSPTSLAVSPDHRSLYATSADPATVSAVRTARGSGAMRPVGCLTSARVDGCEDAPALGGAADVIVSPDNANAYVAAPGDRAVSSFSRNLNGTLDQIGCFSANPELERTCGAFFVFLEPRSIAMTASGDVAYVADSSSSTVSVLTRAFGGDLRPVTCISPFDGCLPGRAMLAVTDVAVAGDAPRVYASSPEESTVAVFDRPE